MPMKKSKVLLLLITIILFYTNPLKINAVTMDEYREAVAEVGRSAASSYSEEFFYSYFWGGTVDNPINMKSKTTDVWLKNAKNGIKSSGNKYGSRKSDPGIKGSFKDRFAVFCESFVQLIVHHASNGAVSYPSDYEKIKVSEIQKGDLIHFPNHIAIFLDDANDSRQGTNTVAEASSKISVRVLENTPDYGYRLKESALAKLNYIYVTSSYDFHDRLDDAQPIITNLSVNNSNNTLKIQATDYKHYSLSDRSDILEPENYGIAHYQITTSSSTPTSNWTKVTPTSNFTKEISLSKNGTYYVWVKDVGGNISKKQINVSTLNFDKTGPSLGNLTYNIFDNSIEVLITGATDTSGIKEYRYYLNNQLIYTGQENKYLFNNLNSNQTYLFYYEIVDKKNNLSKSNDINIKTSISAKSITLDSYNINLLKNASYNLNPHVDIDADSYIVKYKSDNLEVALVNGSGTIYAVNPGTANITISVGNTSVTIQTNVVKEELLFLTTILPNATINEFYSQPIITSVDADITFSYGTLPPGLTIENNKIVGTPTNNAQGEYQFTLVATTDYQSIEQELTIKINEIIQEQPISKPIPKPTSNNILPIIIITVILIIAIIGYLFFKKQKQN